MNNPTVLYVDDEFINLELFEANLGDKYCVLLAHNGASGLKVLEARNDIQVVISDMKMPNMNGIEFISKAKEKYPSIKYYILTGYDVSNELRDALNQGLIIKCFQKPFNMNDLDTEIRKVTG